MSIKRIEKLQNTFKDILFLFSNQRSTNLCLLLPGEKRSMETRCKHFACYTWLRLGRLKCLLVLFSAKKRFSLKQYFIDDALRNLLSYD